MGFDMERPNYLDWIDDPEEEYEDNWEYRTFDGYPPGDSDIKVILDFIEDAKSAEEAIVEDLVAEGMDEEEAREKCCQWPLRDDAPIEIVREFIGIQHNLQEAAKRGTDV